MNGDKEWSPRERRLLVRGRSAFALLGWIVWGVGIGLVLLVILVGGMLVRGAGYGGSWFLTAIVIAILLDAAFLNWLAIWVQVKKRREFRAGYTTLMNEKPELDQVDPDSGHVIRVAGEPFLVREEHLRRIRLIREVIGSTRSDPVDSGEPPEDRR
ncbi:hypothetical protein ACFQBY_05295 [Promicromonospora citrea]|uniref:Uncharacterized protein n=1 Tax=Promicromonospora citrea TaxID=43677 RepID=A0A8H9L3P5_9MICO|nr:hypothetical protein [Promicromonospora citrea]NNH50900.1 hypothetical protein [Promicromonospora citrea]GGM15167.1 hypothetical protein GCM10010102_08390 [Promicromonospora citrea]